MRYSFISQKDALDRAIASVRTGVPIPRDDRAGCADVLASVRDWIASHERYAADKGRETARGLREAMAEDIRRIR